MNINTGKMLQENVLFSGYNLSFCMCICKWHVFHLMLIIISMSQLCIELSMLCTALSMLCTASVKYSKKHTNDLSVTDM